MNLSKPLFRAAEYLWERTPDSLRRQGIVVRVKSIVKEALLRHDDIYDRSYYLERRDQARGSANIIAGFIVRDLMPGDVLDAGCATGDLLAALRSRGVSARGVEYSREAVKDCLEQGLSVSRLNLEKDAFSSAEYADVVVSTEVAEHLPESSADHYVNQLTTAKRWVVFTAAKPGQGGLDHVNEQPREYWIEKFQRRGFLLDAELTALWQREWELLPITGHYRTNLMLFRRGSK